MSVSALSLVCYAPWRPSCTEVSSQSDREAKVVSFYMGTHKHTQTDSSVRVHTVHHMWWSAQLMGLCLTRDLFRRNHFSSNRHTVYIPSLAGHTFHQTYGIQACAHTATALYTRLCAEEDPLDPRGRTGICSVYLWLRTHAIFQWKRPRAHSSQACCLAAPQHCSHVCLLTPPKILLHDYTSDCWTLTSPTVQPSSGHRHTRRQSVTDKSMCQHTCRLDKGNKVVLVNSPRLLKNNHNNREGITVKGKCFIMCILVLCVSYANILKSLKT